MCLGCGRLQLTRSTDRGAGGYLRNLHQGFAEELQGLGGHLQEGFSRQT